MRHSNKKYKIGTTSSHRKSILRGLASQIIEYEKIITTKAKCKAVRPYIEKLITIAKRDSVSNRRLAYSRLGNRIAVNKLFNNIAPKYKDRNGGYTRVLSLADGRLGDNAKMGTIILV